MLAYDQKEDLRLNKEIEGKNSQQTQRDQPSVQMSGRNETVDYSKLNLFSWTSSMNQIMFWELKMSQWTSQAPSPISEVTIAMGRQSSEELQVFAVT